jgi:hypothetical protein
MLCWRGWKLLWVLRGCRERLGGGRGGDEGGGDGERRRGWRMSRLTKKTKKTRMRRVRVRVRVMRVKTRMWSGVFCVCRES